nr:MAG TPA: tail-collar fiber protein [Caudoviricetes sp.]
MAQYPKLRTTNKGRELIASANGQKKAIEYTKAVIGNGDYSGSIDTLLDVVSPKMECSLISGTHEDSQYNLVFTVGNQNLDTGFFAKEIGIYGNIEGSSNEVLFAYTNGGSLVDYIPDKTVPLDAQTVSASIAVGDAEQVIIKKVDGTYITLKQLSDHNLDPNAHGGLLTRVQNEVKVATDALAIHNTATNAHPPITAMIAKILGASNWQENPAATLKDIKNLLGTGGIVAQRLEENGFVKFANGFTIQWGKIQDNTTASRLSYRLKEVTLPLTFSSNWYAVLTTQISLFSTPKEELDRLGAIIISTKAVNKFTMQLDDYSAGAYWLAIGA